VNTTCRFLGHVAILLLLGGCARIASHSATADPAASASVSSPSSRSVTSFASLPVEPYAEQLANGTREREPWSTDPVSIALELLGPFPGRSVGITKTDGPGEAPRTSSVTIVQDGLPDDSVAGVWHRLSLVRGDDGSWSIVSVERAFRCARGGPDAFQSELCP